MQIIRDLHTEPGKHGDISSARNAPASARDFAATLEI